MQPKEVMAEKRVQAKANAKAKGIRNRPSPSGSIIRVLSHQCGCHLWPSAQRYSPPLPPPLFQLPYNCSSSTLSTPSIPSPGVVFRYLLTLSTLVGQ